MAPATTWRSNPASAPWTPSLVSLNRVTDTLGGVTYYAPDDPLPAGLTVGDEAFSVLHAASFGAAPLYRVIDGEGRRGVSADGSTGGVRVERLLGYVESAPVPGSRMLAGADGRVFGWVYPASLVPEVDHATLLGETRPWWRTIETTGGRHLYGIPSALRLMADEGLTLEGVVTHLLVEPSAESDSHPVYPFSRVTSSAASPPMRPAGTDSRRARDRRDTSSPPTGRGGVRSGSSTIRPPAISCAPTSRTRG